MKVERWVFAGLWLALLIGFGGLLVAKSEADHDLLVKDTYRLCAERHETPAAIESCVDWIAGD
jgi:hypothetical protein